MARVPLQLLLGLPLVFLGCGGGGGSKPDTPVTPSISVTAVFSSSAYNVFSDKLEWSPDGARLAFDGALTAGSGGMDIFTVAASAGATPVKVTNWADLAWEAGGKTPSYLANGTLTYYTGNYAGTNDMQVMAAASGQVGNVPAPTVLHTFNSSSLGAAANYTATPEPVSLSSDGTKGVFCWLASGSSWGIFLLNWSGGAVPVVTPISAKATCVLSRDGAYLAYVKTDGNVAFSPVGGAETVLGPGSEPSWASGNKLGYVSSTGYTIYTVGAGTSKTWPASGIGFQNATLSWDASRFAFRTFSGTSTGISIGTLVD